MTPLRTALVGPGEHTRRNILPALAKCDALSLVAVVGGRRGSAVAARYQTAWVSTVEEAVERLGVEAIIVTTPPSTHYQVASIAIRSGIAVLCEKPLTPTLADTEHLVTQARGNEAVLMEGFMFLVHPQLRALRDQIDRVGLLTLEAAFGFPHRDAKDFRYGPHGGGALLDAGVYPIAAAVELMDAPRPLFARLEWSEDETHDSSGLAIVEDSAGRLGVLQWAFGRAYLNGITAWGGTGVVTCKRAFSKPPQLATSILVESAEQTDTVQIPPADHFLLLLDRFAESIAARDLSSLDSIMDRAVLLDAVQRYAAKGEE